MSSMQSIVYKEIKHRVEGIMANYGIKYSKVPGWLIKERGLVNRCSACILNRKESCCKRYHTKYLCDILGNSEIAHVFFRTRVCNHWYEEQERMGFIVATNDILKDAADILECHYNMTRAHK